MTTSVPPSPTGGPRGRFITVEGIDGAGKSSHLAALAEAIAARGHRLVRTREPGGTALAEALRGLFLSQPMDALTEALLVFAARRDHLAQVIAPALARGDWVLCDRYTDATFAYQGAGRGFDTAVLGQLEAWVQAWPALSPEGPLQPDLTLWFDVDPAVAAQRRAAARQADRLEQENIAFFDRVRQGYAQRAAQPGGRTMRIDASPPLAEVTAATLAAARARPWW